MFISRLFIEGAPLFMTILTIELICLILAAWKAPAWVKEIGILAFISMFIMTCFSLIQIFSAIQAAGDVPLPVLCGGFKVSLITVLYGAFIYAISLIIRIIQKPRI